MTFLPIVERELRVASRRSGTYWSRAQVAMAGLVPTFFLLAGPTGFMTPAQRGSEIFQLLAYLAFFFVIISAVRFTADCISSEKREGTLGLLFLTDLKPYDVVLGKLAATAANAAGGLVGLIPLLAIPALLGGVTLADFGRLVVVLLNTLFFALSVAMFVSVMSWQERKAMGLAIILLLSFCIGLPIVGAVVASLNGLGQLAPWFAQASPGFACSSVRDASYAGAAGAFWFSTAFTHGMGWLFFGLACWWLPAAWQDRPSGGIVKRWRDWCRDLVMGDASSRVIFRRFALDVNPIFWLASRERRAVWYPWILLGSLAVITLVHCALLQVWSAGIWPVFLCSYLLNWFFKHWIINSACQAFAADRDKGALELLLSTPLTIRDVVAGHARALRRQFLAPLSVLIGCEFALTVAALASANDGMDSLLFGFGMAGGILFLILDCVAAAWLGWWFSMVSKNASGAASSVYLRVVVLPWLAVGMVIILVHLFAGRVPEKIVAALVLLTWMAASVLCDLAFGYHARRQILTGLRLAAVKRYSGGEAGTSGWRRLGRAVGKWWAGTRRGSPSPGAA